MPRMVRNFWIDARIDGRRSVLRGGPRSKEGGLALTLYQRREGDVSAALVVTCIACTDGMLCLSVEPRLPSLTEDRRLVIKTRR
jgi:hypothetical protein